MNPIVTCKLSKIMSRIHPTTIPLTNTSTVLTARKSCRKTQFWLKCAGYFCLPCCCLGVSCLTLGEVPKSFLAQYDLLIKMYGGEKKCLEIASKVSRELTLFRTAVTQINNTIDPSLIQTDITLLDVIYANHPRINALRVKSHFNWSSYNSKIHGNTNAYPTEIYNLYLSMGGDYKVVIYGLIEYLCHLYDPTSTIVLDYLASVITDSSLHAMVFGFADAA